MNERNKKSARGDNLFQYPPRYCPCCYRDTPRGRMGDCAECGVVSRTMTDIDLPPLRLPAGPGVLQLLVNLCVALVAGGGAGGGAWLVVRVASHLSGVGADRAQAVGVAAGIVVGFLVFVGVGLLVMFASDKSPSSWNDQ